MNNKKVRKTKISGFAFNSHLFLFFGEKNTFATNKVRTYFFFLLKQNLSLTKCIFLLLPLILTNPVKSQLPPPLSPPPPPAAASVGGSSGCVGSRLAASVTLEVNRFVAAGSGGG